MKLPLKANRMAKSTAEPMRKFMRLFISRSREFIIDEVMLSTAMGMRSQAEKERKEPASALSYTSTPMGSPSSKNSGTNRADSVMEKPIACSI